jgi:F0F1-type ATP synthase beta subunit
MAVSSLGNGHQISNALCLAVKFDTDTLPPILNALETENNGQKRILEVAVRDMTKSINPLYQHLDS